MKTIQNIFFLVIFAFATFSCADKYTEEFTANKPVYMSYKTLRSGVKYGAARVLNNPGKIYFKDDLIFINEQFVGVHIIRTKDPENPENIGFIEIPGNVDIAIKNNILYADSYVDLVAIDISDINKPEEVTREKNVFPYTLPPYEEDYRLAEIDEEKGVVTSWEVTRVRQEMEYHYYPVYFLGAREDYAMMDGVPANGGGGQSSTFGVGGSMTRFGLYNDYLYAVDRAKLHIFEIKTDATLNDIGTQNAGWNVETMFIYDNHMFLGTQSGMRVFSLAVPTVPTFLSDFWHVTSCDPVVVADGYAYITLRGGNTCGSDINRLDVLELSGDYSNNKLIASYPMRKPYGLGIDGDILFICDGDAGLKVYDVSSKTQIADNQIAVFPEINAYDVIPVNGYLFLIGNGGFYLYDYSDIQNIEQIGGIPVIVD